MDDDRVCWFHVGQTWESPRGFFYKVIDCARGGKAILRGGKDGSGRKIKRDWDAVSGWILIENTTNEKSR